MNVALDNACQSIADTHQFILNDVAGAKELQSLKPESHCNGPQGTISEKSQLSTALLLYGLQKCNLHLEQFPNYRIATASLITSVVENLHAVSRLKKETFSAIEYARELPQIVRESHKMSTK